jgi:hypothetical protein
MSSRQHPETGLLALCAGGDLPLAQTVRVRWHAWRCESCAAELRAFAEARRAALRAGSEEMPEGIEWEPLAAEMKANIHLGLAAGAVVDRANDTSAEWGPALPWRRTAAVVFASLSFVIVSGWLLNRPQPAPADVASGAHVEARGEGLVVEQAGSALTLLGPDGRAAESEVDFSGSARARYVDAETGQVTIHHVYAE